MNRTHVMLDLETLGLRAGCVVMQIGAVVFDPMGDKPYDGFKRNVSVASCMRAGLSVDGDTIAWWLRQRHDAFVRLTDPPPVELAAALDDFRRWLYEARRHEPPETVMLWSHGAAFDVPILEAAFMAVGVPAPWCYRNVRDTRTLFDVAGLSRDDMVKPAFEHDALSDAAAQAMTVQAAYRMLARHAA